MARYVLAVAFRGLAWLMVRNRVRGWEFAGGKVKPHETSEQAAARECREETGCAFQPQAGFVFQDGEVFVGRLGQCGGRITDPDIMEWAFVEELPIQLGFPREECEEIVGDARRLADGLRLG